jgi:hypothetical protein
LQTLSVETNDGWTTEHAGAENVRIEGDELVYERESVDLGRHEVRLDLDEIRVWRLVEVHSGLERG